MKLKITGEYNIEELEIVDFSELSGARNNGQHWQLPGHVLAEIGIAPKHIFNLLHPETNGASGHIDVIVDFRGNEITFRRYSGHETISLYNAGLSSIWPSGAWDLLMTVDAIEQFLESRGGYSPVLRNWIIRKL